MATVTVDSLVAKAQVILQDVTKVRWPELELISWLNDGQREVVLIRPQASVSNTTVALDSGKTKQTIPNDGVMLIDVVRNMGSAGQTPGNAIRICSREVLDAQYPDWHSKTNELGYVQHYMYDPRDPKSFWVYPLAPTPWHVQLVYSASPATVVAGGSIAVDDIYSNALVDYMLYRAYSKDAEYAGNAQRAMGHYSAFQNSLGVKTKSELEQNPNLTTVGFNPNIPGQART
jgi:hypothetical protein